MRPCYLGTPAIPGLPIGVPPAGAFWFTLGAEPGAAGAVVSVVAAGGAGGGAGFSSQPVIKPATDTTEMTNKTNFRVFMVYFSNKVFGGAVVVRTTISGRISSR